MKSINAIIKKAALLPLICYSVICFGQPQLPGKNDNDSNSKVEFVKLENDQLIFDVDIRNIPAGGCWLRITNTESDIVFETRISEGSYRKRFKIQNEGFSKLNFEVNGKKYRFNESFSLQCSLQTKWEVTKI
ncbi:MAG: hypothetical protein QM687_07530 [Ferruginibacter sp.]